MTTNRITLLEWSFRTNTLLMIAMGRTMSSFCEDWKWHELYHAGCTPGEVVEAIVEEFASLGLLRSGQAVVN